MSNDDSRNVNDDAALREIFSKVVAGCDLSERQARDCFDRLMDGQLSQATAAALLGALATKGESVDELVGAALAMRSRATRIRCDADCIDTCGTGGDGVSTFNVSTTAAIIAASAGATVAKHGNRSTTRTSGSTEVLTELGIDVNAEPQIVERCLAEVGIGYLNARLLHPAMRYAAPVREAIPVRTIFNLLGPLTNPAGAKRQLVGVPRVDLLDKIASALLRLGMSHGWVVHSDDGLCDLSATGPTTIVEISKGKMSRFRVTPEDVRLKRCSLQDIMVTSPEHSAEVVRSIFTGEKSPARDHALLNAGAALVVAGVAPELQVGVNEATRAVDSGGAQETLTRWQSIAGLNKQESSARGA